MSVMWPRSPREREEHKPDPSRLRQARRLSLAVMLLLLALLGAGIGLYCGFVYDGGCYGDVCSLPLVLEEPTA